MATRPERACTRAAAAPPGAAAGRPSAMTGGGVFSRLESGSRERDVRFGGRRGVSRWCVGWVRGNFDFSRVLEWATNGEA